MADILQVSFVSRNTRTSYKPAVSNDTTEDLFKKALATANTAKDMAMAGKDKNKVFEVFKEALKTADSIKNHFLKNGTIRQISSSMTTAGLNNKEIIALFKEVNVTIPD